MDSRLISPEKTSSAPAAAADAGRPWLRHYPDGVPFEAPVDAFGSVAELLEAAFRRHPQRDASCCMESRLTFRELDTLSQDLGAWLQSLDLAADARVALMMPNLPPYLVAMSAVLRAGLTVVNVNPLYTPRELQHQLKDSGATVLVVLENFAHVAQEVIEHSDVRHVLLTSSGDLLGFWRSRLVNFGARHLKSLVPRYSLPRGEGRTVTRLQAALHQGSRLTFKRVAVSADSVAFLQYTGGTTGASKGATLLHRNVVANIMQCEAWFKPVLDRVGDRQLTIVCALPLYHIFALTICALMGAHFGALNLLIPNPRDIAGFIRTLSAHRVNMFPAVNTLFNALANEPEFAQIDFSELLVSNGGGMAVQRATAEKWLRITGCPVVEGYGLSETSPVATSNRLDVTEFSNGIGYPFPSTEVAIRDDQGGEVPPGTPGEICIRGPQVMAGYWQRPDETAQAMTADGFFRSGDIGVMDPEGYFRIVDRKKDMILVSGFNVYPTEIEQVVGMCPGVLECAAVGVPDAHSGECVRLFVVKSAPSLSEGEVSRYCKNNFAAYKRPKRIDFVRELPKSNVGKVLRRELRGSASTF